MSPLRKLLLWLLLPLLGVVGIGWLAFSEWSKIERLKEIAHDFYQSSRPAVFNYLGTRSSLDTSKAIRYYPTYTYEVGDRTEIVQSREPIELPVDGRVRIGRHPSPGETFGHQSPPWGEDVNGSDIVLPIQGEDSIQSIYTGIRGHDIQQDVIRASVVTAVAVLCGLSVLVILYRHRQEMLSDGRFRPGEFRKPIMTQEEQDMIRLLAWVHLVLGPLVIVGAGLLMWSLVLDPVTDLILWLAAVYLSLVGISFVVGGVGILKRKRWALPWMKTSGVLLLWFFPLGTALGLWTLASYNRLTVRRR